MKKIKGLKIIFSKKEIKMALSRMKKVMEIGYVASGENVKGVESLVKKITKVKYSIATSSGTSALECIFSGLKNLYGIDYALITDNTFIATALSAEKAGLKYDFVGINDNLMIDRQKVINKIKKSKHKSGVVVCVHIGGLIETDFNKFVKEVENLGWYVVEDCAHAVGTKNAGKFGVAGAFSFFATKVLTGGEGGCIVTKDNKLAKYCKLYRNFGKENAWVTDYKIKGYNHRMNELAACLIRTELENIDSIKVDKRRIFLRYCNALDRLDIINVRFSLLYNDNLFYKIIFMDNPDIIKELRKVLNSKGIELQGEVYNRPLSSFKIFGKKKTDKKIYDLCRSHLCLPIYRGMLNSDIDYVCKVINNFYNN